jgi:hypothetical protein
MPWASNNYSFQTSDSTGRLFIVFEFTMAEGRQHILTPGKARAGAPFPQRTTAPVGAVEVSLAAPGRRYFGRAALSPRAGVSRRCVLLGLRTQAFTARHGLAEKAA